MTLTYEKRNLDNIAKLADHSKAAALKWHAFLVANNIDVLIYETIRTKEKQAENVRKGVSQTMRSYHIVGQALDFVPVVNGKIDYGAYKLPNIQQAIAEAKRIGFEWGGDWKGFVDKPHLQFNYRGYGTDTFISQVIEVPNVPTQPNAPIAKVLVLVDGLKLRKGPGQEYSVNCKANKGDVLDVYANLNDWHNVGGDNWVFGNNGQYLSLDLNALKPKYPYPGAVIKEGAHGESVKMVQRIVGVKVDGNFGPKTKAAVKAYQNKKGLTADGIVGPATWAAMF